MSPPVLVLCSHGTRSALGASLVSGLVRGIAHALPEVDVREAHVDVHPPFLDDVVSPGCVVVPLLLAPGYHVDVDIEQAATRVGARVTAAMGPDDLLTELLLARLAELDEPLAPEDVVVLAAAGSSVAGSERATRETARLLGEALDRPVHAGYGASCEPLLPDLVARLRKEHPGRRAVAASYLLAPGHFLDRVRACGVDDATGALLDEDGPDERLVRLVVRRFEAAQERPDPVSG